MNTGRYAVVRFIPDPARGETFNVGILIWVGNKYDLRIDRDAARRAERANPRLASESLRHLEQSMKVRIGDEDAFSEGKMEAFLDHKLPIYVSLGDPCFVKVSTIEETLASLMDRLVRPIHTYTPDITPERVVPRDTLDTRIASLISENRVMRNHPVKGAKTRYTRHVDYFVNSGANVAMDHLHPGRRKPTQIAEMADAEAYKILDILETGEVKRYVVFYESTTRQAEAFDFANETLRSAGAEVVTDLGDAEAAIKNAVGTLDDAH